MRIDSRKPKAAALSAALTVALLAGAGATDAHAATLSDTVGSTPSEATLVQPVDYRGDGYGSSNTSAASYVNGSGLTRSAGVNNYNGRREPYYSSKVLYHDRTGEWTQDSEGFWRDSDGYYVVAAGDKAQGSTFTGSKGECKVYDSGCAAGTTDYYTGW